MGRFYDAEDNRQNNSALTGLIIALCICLGFVVIITVISITEGDSHFVKVCTVIGLIVIAEIIFFVIIRKMLERVSKYRMIFEEDHDGVITFARLSELTGIPEARIRKDITKTQKHRFSNIRVEGDTLILGSEDELEDVICPTCGATNRVRIGSSDKCNNCGSYLRRA